MYKVKHNLTPSIFKNQFKNILHKYPTRFSFDNFVQPKMVSKTTSYAIPNRGPYLWNNILDTHCKSANTLSEFKKRVKEKLLNIDYEMTYF